MLTYRIIIISSAVWRLDQFWLLLSSYILYGLIKHMLQISPSRLPFLLVHPKCDLILNHRKHSCFSFSCIQNAIWYWIIGNILAFPSNPSLFTSTVWINFGAARPLNITLRKFKLLDKAKNGAFVWIILILY